MAVSIRKAERRDLESLGRLGAMLVRTHHDFDKKRFIPPIQGVEAGYAHFLENFLESADNAVLVADEDGAVHGYVYAALEPLSYKELRGPAGFIHDIAVAAEARRSGIGTKLMQAAMDWLRERGAPRVILWTAAPNAAAQSLFHRFGFRDTMIEMTKELAQPG